VKIFSSKTKLIKIKQENNIKLYLNPRQPPTRNLETPLKITCSEENRLKKERRDH